eukprot:458511_1
MASTAHKLPHFAKEAPSIADHSFKIHIAIDFGTDGTSLAYALPDKLKEKTVYVHKDWVSVKFNSQVKPKTIILLDENGETIGFGKDAKNTYITSMNMSKRWMLFERFKMSLYENNDIKEDYKTNNDDEKTDKKTNAKSCIKQELTAANGNKTDKKTDKKTDAKNCIKQELTAANGN